MNRSVTVSMVVAILLLTMIALFQAMLNVQMIDVVRTLIAEVNALSQRLDQETHRVPREGVPYERPRL